MAADASQPQQISRRKLLQLGGAVGVGLAAGGATGYAAGQGSSPVAATSGATATSDRPLRIGSSLSLTGFAAADGAEHQRGLELAVSEINAAGGIHGREVETVILDVGDQSVETMVSNFERLVNRENVDALIVGYHVSSGDEYDIVAEAGTPYFHVNAQQRTADIVREDPEKYGMIFHSCPTETWYGKGLPLALNSLADSGPWKPENKKIAVVTAQYPYSKLIADVLRDEAGKAGWEVSLFEQVTSPVAEWGPVLSKIRRDPPAVIVNTDFLPSDLATFAKQFATDPTQSLLYEQYGPSVPEFLELAGDAANGVLWSTVVGVLPDPIGDTFKKNYKAAHGQEPGFSASGSTYDMTMVWRNAALGVNDPADGAAVAARVRESIYRGVCGTYRYDPADLTIPPYPEVTKDASLGMPHLYFQIQDGEHVVFGPDSHSNGQFQLPPWFS